MGGECARNNLVAKAGSRPPLASPSSNDDLSLEATGTEAETIDEKSVEVWFSPQWPTTDPELFGREDELAWLDAAWEDGGDARGDARGAGGRREDGPG